MKKIFLLSMFGWLMVSCTKEGPASDPDTSTPSDLSFLSIKIVSAQGGGSSRADGDTYEQGDGLYKDGTEAESSVNNVLLLFFDDSGNPAQIMQDSNGNARTYFLWEPSATDRDGHATTVESILEGSIPINVPRRNDNPIYPTSLLAIVNPPQVSDYTDKTLTALRAKFADYETGLSSTGKFVMTNSVYVDNEAVVDTNSLTADNFQKTADEAKKHAIVIYVERILARIDLQIAISGTNEDGTEYPRLITPENGDPYYIYYTGESIPTDKQEPGNDADVYIRFLGWNLFNTPDQSYLMKHVDKKWDSKTLFGYEDGVMPWNIAAFRRSFWAINPKERAAENGSKADGIYHKIGTFDEVGVGDFNEANHQWSARKYEIPEPDKTTTAYFQENAAPDGAPDQGPAKQSTVVLAAQLVDKDGNPREIAKFAGKYYTWYGLRAMLTDKYESNDYQLKDLYYGEAKKDANENTGMQYTKIMPEDLGYTTTEGSYLVTVTLAKEGNAGAARTWYVKVSDTTYTPVEEYVETFTQGENESANTAATNQYIKNKIGSQTVMVWKNGYSYFHFAIRHLGEIGSNAPGEFGIVRNHIYEATVKSVYGLGTPVENRDEVFFPNEEETGGLAAEVHILSWRVVRHDYELSW